MTNLDSTLKSRDITLSTKVRLGKAMVFPVVTYGCESWTVKKASIRVFSNESFLRIRWPKYWSFSFCISPSNKYSALISFRIDRLELLAVEGTLKSLLQQHSSKASVLQHSALFIIQLSHPYLTTGKTIALTRWTIIDKVMSLLLNMLSRLVITFFPQGASIF